MHNWTVLRERKPPPRKKSQPKLIRDVNPDFRINPDSDPDVHRIAAMLWIHYRVGISHFAECRKKSTVTVCKMLRNLLKPSSILQWRGKWKSDAYPGPDHPSNVDRFLRLVGPIIASSFNEIG